MKVCRGMTIGQLHKALGKLIDNGHIRRRVCISKETFSDNRESDGCTILNVHAVEMLTVNMADDDGGTAMTKAGLEMTQLTAVLFGWGVGRSE